MRYANVQFGGFGYDSCIRMPAFDDGAGTDAGIFFVYNPCNDYITTQVTLPGYRSGSHDGSKPAFHVVGSPTIQAITFYIRIMRSLHSGYADCIHVRVEQERASSTCTMCYANDVGAPRCRFVQFDF